MTASSNSETRGLTMQKKASERLRMLRASAPSQGESHGDIDYSERPALDVANFLIDLGDYTKTPLQIQKMAYIAHGHTLAILGKPLFGDQVEAWQHGPVVENLYDALKDWEYFPIPEVSGPISVPFDAAEREIMRLVYREYGKYCGYYLSQLSHNDGHLETPWAQCYDKGRNAIIPNYITKEYYEKYLE